MRLRRIPLAAIMEGKPAPAAEEAAPAPHRAPKSDEATADPKLAAIMEESQHPQRRSSTSTSTGAPKSDEASADPKLAAIMEGKPAPAAEEAARWQQSRILQSWPQSWRKAAPAAEEAAPAVAAEDPAKLAAIMEESQHLQPRSSIRGSAKLAAIMEGNQHPQPGAASEDPAKLAAIWKPAPAAEGAASEVLQLAAIMEEIQHRNKAAAGGASPVIVEVRPR